MPIFFKIFILIGEGRDGAVVRALASSQCGSGSVPGPGARFSKERKKERIIERWRSF